MEAVRTLKANLKIAGRPCGWCQTALKLGDDAAICTACEKDHHRACWDGNAGCSTAGCVSAPLRRLDEPSPQAGSAFPQAVGSPFSQGAPFAQAAAPPPGYMTCPNPSCRVALVLGTQVCPACRAITTPDGIYHGPKVNAPGAVASLVYGLIGFMFFGVILGIVAISKANAAKRAMATDPTLGGAGFATAGLVMGIIDLIAWAILLIGRAS